MKSYKYSLFVIILFSKCLFAQENLLYEKTFAGYTSYVSKDFGISCSMPGEFSDLNKYFVLQKIRKNRQVGYLYGPILQAKDKKCIVMYPGLPRYVSKKNMEIFKKMAMINEVLFDNTSETEPKVGNNNTYPRSHITSELKAAIGLFDYYGKPLNDSVSFDFNDYVTIIAGKRTREMFNADSVYFYDIPLEEPYQKKYTYCTGMVLSKQNRTTMVFKWFFTSKGKKKAEQYINQLSKQIWYDENFRSE